MFQKVLGFITLFKMPRKSDLIPIANEELDRRVKLTSSDKIQIKQLYESGEYSQRGLARMFSVSRRSIQFIIDPDKLEANKQRRAELGGSKRYYDKEKHTKAIREHRQYKDQLFKQGKI